MNEENKYYVPEISEFHVGFEYEITNGYEWVKKVYSQEHFNTFLYKHLDNAIIQEQVQVKYLDSEDIESLGWNNLSRDGFYGFLLNEHHLCFNEETNNYMITKHNTETVKNIMFNGKIKNKSELKRIMKQVGI